MQSRTARRLGIAVLVLPAPLAFSALSLGLLGSSVPLLGVVLAVLFGALSWALFVALAFMFLSAAAGGPAEKLMQAAVISGVVVWLGGWALDNVVTSLIPAGPGGAPAFPPTGYWEYAVLAVVPFFLFALGLLRSGWLPRWIPWLGVGVAVLLEMVTAGNSPASRLVPPVVFGVVDTAALVASVVFLVALGTALLLRSRLDGPSQAGEDTAAAEPGDSSSDPVPHSRGRYRAAVVVVVAGCTAVVLSTCAPAALSLVRDLGGAGTAERTRPASAALTRVQIPIIKQTIDRNAKRLRSRSKDITHIKGDEDIGDPNGRVVYTVTIDHFEQPWFFYFDDLKHPTELGEINAWPGGSGDAPEVDWTVDQGWTRSAAP